MASDYLIKFVPRAGYRVFALEFSRRHLAFAAVLLTLTVGCLGGYYVWLLQHAEARVGALRSLTAAQRDRLKQIDAHAMQLDSELHALRRQNEQIRKLIGDGDKATARVAPLAHGNAAIQHPSSGARGVQSYRADDSFGVVAARIERLRADSSHMHADGDRLRNLALHVLNMRRLEDLARARILAAVPSLNPVGHLAIASAFGWRVIPWPEFHSGVDLEADYGDDVRSGAAGTVVSVGYDGGYGIKVDLDHGNGYHTWYCHLSRADVHAGQNVRKAEHIALVGSTGASTGPHLHYQIMLDGRPVDPLPYLRGVPERVIARLK